MKREIAVTQLVNIQTEKLRGRGIILCPEAVLIALFKADDAIGINGVFR